ncbi:MAG: ATP-binding protein [Streptosporangiaceae bacterium]
MIEARPGLLAGAALPGHEAGVVRNFPRALESTRGTRHFVLDTLDAPGDDALAVEAAIVTAELAANAVLHARSDFTVAVSRSAAGVRISVRDAAPLEATIGHAPLAVSPGDGLWVVAQVADSWPVESLPDGKVLWAELPASSR